MTKTEKSLNVGLIGYGFAGKTFHAPLIAHTPGLNLSTVVSSDRAKVVKDYGSISVTADAEALFSDEQIDLVVIATPNTSHFELAVRALEAGKHVVIDKPMATSSADARSLVDLARDKKLFVSVFQNRRYDADFLTLKRIIETDKLGQISHFQSNYDRFRPEVQSRWREKALPGSGVWFDLGSHLVDQVVALFGAPDTVYGDMEVQRAGAEADDYFHVVLSYGKMKVILHGSTLVLAETPRFAVHGTAGSYVKAGIDTQEDSLKAGKTPGSYEWGVDPRMGSLTVQVNGLVDGKLSTKLEPNQPGNYLAYYEAVRDAILLGSNNPVDPKDTITVMKILELASDSSRNGRVLAV